MEKKMDSHLEKHNLRVSHLGFKYLCAHVPIFLIQAWYFKTEFSIALGLSSFILFGVWAVINKRGKEIYAHNIIAFSMMAFSAILIHLGKGMIEWHFNIFVSLALLILSANISPLIVAAATAAVHHLTFYFFLPKSVFNYDASLGIVVLHAAFVIVETIAAVYITAKFGNIIKLQDTSIKKLNSIINNYKKTSTTVNDYSDDLLRSTEFQGRAVEKTASSLEEISHMIQKTLKAISDTSKMTEESENLVLKSSKAMQKAKSIIDSVQKTQEQTIEHLSATTKSFSALTNVLDEVSAKARVIDDIVIKTQLLSFNASIEAARAGEHGKGFSIVAEEVGNLARLTGEAASEISNILSNASENLEEKIKSFQSEILSASGANKGKIEESVTQITNVDEILEKIVEQVNLVSSQVKEIEMASSSQTKGANEITNAIEDINRETNNTSKISKETIEVAKILHIQSTNVFDLVQELTDELDDTKNKKNFSLKKVA